MDMLRAHSAVSRTLYVGPVSWFSRKVEAALYEKGLAFTQILVPFSQPHGYFDRPADVARIHPKRQVPVMIEGGLELYDSTVIIEYIEDAYPQPCLLPPAPADRARCRMWDVFGDEIMIEPIRKLMHRTELHDPASARWLQMEAVAFDAMPRIAAHFDELDHALQGQDYLCSTFSVADIACLLGVFWSNRLAGPGFGPRANLRRWYGTLMRRASIARVTGEIIGQDRRLSAPVAGAFSDC